MAVWVTFTLFQGHRGTCRHGIFLPIGEFPPIERSHRSFLRSVQIRGETYRVYLRESVAVWLKTYVVWFEYLSCISTYYLTVPQHKTTIFAILQLPVAMETSVNSSHIGFLRNHFVAFLFNIITLFFVNMFVISSTFDLQEEIWFVSFLKKKMYFKYFCNFVRELLNVITNENRIHKHTDNSFL